jgi:putative membrane protein
MKMQMRSSRLRALVLAAYGATIAGVIASGRFPALVNPVYLLPVCAGAFLLSVIILIELNQNDSHRRIPIMRVAVMLAPVLLVAVVGISTGGQSLAIETVRSGDIRMRSDPLESAREIPARPIPEIRTVDDANFYSFIRECYADPQSVAGQRVRFTGVVHRDTDRPAAHDFAVIRLMMVCCAADVQPVGLMCVKESGVMPRDRQWYAVDGVLEARMGDAGMEPVLRISELAPTGAPANEYIYPF